MQYTIEALAHELQYRDAETNELKPVVSIAAIKMAANRGAVTAIKDEKGRWLIDDQSPLVKKWFVKKNLHIAEEDNKRAEIKAEKERQRIEGNLRAENEILRKEKAHLSRMHTDVAQYSHELEKQLSEAKKKITDLTKQLEESNLCVSTLRQQLDASEKIADERKNLLDLLANATTKISHNETKTTARANRQPKQPSPDQAAKDEATLQGWEKWQQEHDNPQVKDYAESLGRKRTTVNGQLARARRNRENQQENSTTE